MEKRLFDAAESSLVSIRDFINSWADANGLSAAISNKMAICTDEIASNVVLYSSASKLEISCNLQDSEITVIFSDDGRPFDPLTDSVEPDVNAGLEERKIGGLGIFLVKKMAQSVSYELVDGKNVLKTVFAVG